MDIEIPLANILFPDVEVTESKETRSPTIIKSETTVKYIDV
jgi:hypothetical protein